MERSAINHVLIDFENVQDVDLLASIDKPLSLILLVGARQKSLKTELVEQLLRRAAHVQLIQLAASGKNALDFALAYHLGRATAADPTGFFHIVSKDQGFDPLVAQLKQQHLRVSRHDSFAALHALLTKTPPPAAPAAAPLAPVAKDRVAEFIDNLKRNAANRPKRKATLLSHLNSHFGGTLTPPELEAKFTQVQGRLGLVIGDKGAVTYP